MSEPITVVVDPTNPGQFFACCGLLELADRLWPGAEGWFAADGREFYVYREGMGPESVLELLDALIGCSAFTQTELDAASTHPELAGAVEEEAGEGGDEKTPKSDPVILGSPISLTLDWWLRSNGTETLFKTWAANATSQQMFRKWRLPLKALRGEVPSNPRRVLELPTKVQGSYGFDSLLGWDAFEVGFSLNEHNSLKKLPTRPAVELLAAIGLQGFRPQFNERERTVKYATWTLPLLPAVARATSSGELSGLTASVYCSRFVSRGTFKGLDYATLLPGDARE